MTEIQTRLFALQDRAYGDFIAKLLPTLPRERIIGIRTPALRKLAKELSGSGEAAGFMAELPHAYFEENSLHAFLLEQIRDFEACLAGVERFLSCVDNWATCDSFSPRVFSKHHGELLPRALTWLDSGETYTVRFGIKILMDHFLEEDFKAEYLDLVSVIRSEEYYVNMMRAWYFATALAKQWESTLPILREGRLDRWTHSKTIQKACESFRITPEQKALLRKLKQR